MRFHHGPEQRMIGVSAAVVAHDRADCFGDCGEVTDQRFHRLGGQFGIGTIAFVVLYLADGGLSSLSGILMGLGILGIGLLVLAFGLVTFAFAYRLENHRLMQAYQELRAVLVPESPARA